MNTQLRRITTVTRKPNFAKCILGVFVLALLFIGTWAVTRAPRASAKKPTASATKTAASTNPKMATHLMTALTPSTGTDSIFNTIELDGDIFDDPPGTPDDWTTLNCDGLGGAFIKTGVIPDAPNATIFTQGGSKDISDVTEWKYTDGSVPDKDDIENAYAAKYTGPTGDTILAFGADRFANTGTAFIGVWFFKNPIGLGPPAGNGTGPFTGAHSVGDVLVLSTFTQGGSIATSKVFEWVGTGGDQKQGTMNDITATAPANAVFSISNGAAQAIPGTCSAWQHTP